MTELTATTRLAERKLREKQARGARIVSAARQIAEAEGWPAVTVRRLADEICYSQPVLYAHFGSREGVISAVALQGFAELGQTLEKARMRSRRGSAVAAVAGAYLDFAVAGPALYEAMFQLHLNVPFGEAATPPELRFAFQQMLELFTGGGVAAAAAAEVRTELFWASLHGVAELMRTRRLPGGRQKERLKELLGLFKAAGAEAAETRGRAEV